MCRLLLNAFVWLGLLSGCQRSAVGVHVEERADSIAAIASLSDPQKLQTLKPENRSVNGRMDKILYWLSVAEGQGIGAERAVSQAFQSNGTIEPRLTVAKRQVLMNYKAAKRWGLFTKENLEKLKRGNAAFVTKGTYAGEKAEIDHIVPVARYPQYGNELANLQVMSGPMNRSKADRMGNLEWEKLEELQRLSSVNSDSLNRTTSACLRFKPQVSEDHSGVIIRSPFI
jgi:hypothetical protein